MLRRITRKWSRWFDVTNVGTGDEARLLLVGQLLAQDERQRDGAWYADGRDRSGISEVRCGPAGRNGADDCAETPSATRRW